MQRVLRFLAGRIGVVQMVQRRQASRRGRCSRYIIASSSSRSAACPVEHRVPAASRPARGPADSSAETCGRAVPRPRQAAGRGEWPRRPGQRGIVGARRKRHFAGANAAIRVAGSSRRRRRCATSPRSPRRDATAPRPVGGAASDRRATRRDLVAASLGLLPLAALHGRGALARKLAARGDASADHGCGGQMSHSRPCR